MSTKFIFYSVVLLVFALINSEAIAQTGAIASKRIQTFDESHHLISEYLQTSDGEKTGIAYYWYSSGDLQAIFPYDNGRITGTIFIFYKGRVVKSECRKNDILDGPSINYYASGLIKTKQVYVDGKQVGSMIHYDDNANVPVKEQKKIVQPQ